MSPSSSIADRAGEIIVAEVGKNRATPLAHPGMPTAEASVAEAVFRADFMERGTRLRLDAAAFGGVKPVDAGAEGVRAISCSPSAS